MSRVDIYRSGYSIINKNDGRKATIVEVSIYRGVASYRVRVYGNHFEWWDHKDVINSNVNIK